MSCRNKIQNKEPLAEKNSDYVKTVLKCIKYREYEYVHKIKKNIKGRIC